MAIRSWNDIQKEMKDVMINIFTLVKLNSLLVEFYLNMYNEVLNMYKYHEVSCCSNSFENHSLSIAPLSNWSLKIGD